MKIAVSLVTWNGANFIRDCLDSLFAQTYKDFSVLIIDNGSTDDTVQIISERYPQLRVVKHKTNLGFAKAHNQAIHWTEGDYVLVLNQDIVLEPEFLNNLVYFLDTNPEVGAVSGKLLKLQDKQKTNYIDSLGLKISTKHQVVDIGAGEMDEAQYDAIEEVFGVSGAAPMYRRSALKSVQYKNEFFDEDFFSYKEDVDLSYRLRYAGWKIYKVPLAVAYHNRSVVAPQNEMTLSKTFWHRRGKSRFANFYSYRNHLYLLMKNLPKQMAYLLPVLSYELFKFGYVLFCEPYHWKIWREVWINRKKMLEKRQVIMSNSRATEAERKKWYT
jgi:GT2 family glycosyltransferase